MVAGQYCVYQFLNLEASIPMQQNIYSFHLARSVSLCVYTQVNYYVFICCTAEWANIQIQQNIQTMRAF